MPGSAFLRKATIMLLCGSWICGALPAQDSDSSPGTIPRAERVEKPKKPGLFQRLFSRKPAPTPLPTPAPTPTPKPKARKRPKATPAITPAESPAANLIDPANPNPGLVPLPDSPEITSPDSNAGSAPLPDALPPLVGGSVNNSTEVAGAIPVPTVVSTPTPLPPEVVNNPMNQPIPLIDDSSPLQITPGITNPAEEQEKEALQRTQFQKAKARALEDSKLQALKEKSELASTPAERYAALKEYYPRLFASMRKIDGTLAIAIDEMEAASQRRLERMENEKSAPAR